MCSVNRVAVPLEGFTRWSVSTRGEHREQHVCAMERVGSSIIVFHVILRLRPMVFHNVVDEKRNSLGVACAGPFVAVFERYARSLRRTNQGSDEEEGRNRLHGDLRKD